MSVLLYLAVAGVTGIALVRTLRGQAQSRRYLEEGISDQPLELSHLSGPLRRLTEDTRTVRISLEGPLRRLRATRTISAADRDELRLQLAELSRELMEWLQSVDRLPPDDKRRLQELGDHPGKVRTVLLRSDPGVDLDRGRKQAVEALERVHAELEAVERGLEGDNDPYR